MTKELTKAPIRARAKRTPINVRNKLTIQGKDPNYVYRIVNDADGRVDWMKDDDYELVPAKDVRVGDKRLDAVSPEGSFAQLHVGGGMKAVVMRKPKEWYDEDQAEKQARVLALEQTTKQQALAQNELKNGKLVLERD